MLFVRILSILCLVASFVHLYRAKCHCDECRGVREREKGRQVSVILYITSSSCMTQLVA